MTFSSRPHRPAQPRSLMSVLGQLPFAGRLFPMSHADAKPRGHGHSEEEANARAIRTGERASHW